MSVLLFSHSVVSNSFVTPWTIACKSPLSMDSPGKNTGVGCHFLSSGDLSDPGIEHMSPTLQVDSLPLSHQGRPHVCLCPF